MVISPKYRYLFIEVPHTASTAISAELRKYYGGELILHKHANYSEFLRGADRYQKRYRVFAAVRNPLDAVVTEYFKFQTDHHGVFSDPTQYWENGGWISQAHVARWRFVQDHPDDFESYFRRFFTSTYCNWFLVGHSRFEFVMRYEAIGSQFEEMIARCGLELKRPLPVVNKSRRPRDFASVYPQSLHSTVFRLFGPYMREWGYSFPSTWGDAGKQRVPQMKYFAKSRMVNGIATYLPLRANSRLVQLGKRCINAIT